MSGVSYALYPNLSPGYGFTAIAVALLAGLHPAGVVMTGILFGALEAGSGSNAAGGRSSRGGGLRGGGGHHHCGAACHRAERRVERRPGDAAEEASRERGLLMEGLPCWRVSRGGGAGCDTTPLCRYR